jgi:hypothetical protein
MHATLLEIFSQPFPALVFQNILRTRERPGDTILLFDGVIQILDMTNPNGHLTPALTRFRVPVPTIFDHRIFNSHMQSEIYSSFRVLL